MKQLSDTPYRFAILLCLLLAGCEGTAYKALTPQEIAAARDECLKHGLKATTYQNLNMDTIKVGCTL